jgi:hypothetical protein
MLLLGAKRSIEPTVARYSASPPTNDRLWLAVLRAAAVLVVGLAALVALSYWSYLGFTDMRPEPVDVPAATPEVDPTGRRVTYGRSWLTRRGRLWHAHFEGPPDAIGDAHGRLLSRQLRRLHAQVRARIDQRYTQPIEQWAASMVVRWETRGADAALAPEDRRELSALARAAPSGLDPELASYPLLFHYQSLFSLVQRLEDALVEGNVFAVAPRRSSPDGGGNLLVGRSFSVDLGPDFHADTVVAFHYPDGRYPYVTVGWPGLIGVVTGVNARGIVVAVNPTRVDEPLADGPPLPMVLKRVLEQADTLDQALKLVREASFRTPGVVFLGDGVAREAVVLELAPRSNEERRTDRGRGEPLLWATDHLLTDPFVPDAQNDWVRRYTSSGYRYDRLGELLSERRPATPDDLVAVLRDRRGDGGAPLGLGNRNALEHLHLAHAVVIDATAMVMWVGEGPSALGRFRAFDLRHLLGRQGTRPAPLPDIEADPLLYSEEYRDYEEALDAIDYARARLDARDPEGALWSARVAEALAPDVGDLQRLLGDIQRARGELAAARTHYERYLELVPGRLRDQERVRTILAEIAE